MSEFKRYRVVLSLSAQDDITAKMDYIRDILQSSETSLRWYRRLYRDIMRGLSTMPYKYPAYPSEPWKTMGVRYMNTGSDVVLYTVDEEHGIVNIQWVCTAGRDLEAHMQ